MDEDISLDYKYLRADDMVQMTWYTRIPFVSADRSRSTAKASNHADNDSARRLFLLHCDASRDYGEKPGNGFGAGRATGRGGASVCGAGPR